MNVDILKSKNEQAELKAEAAREKRSEKLEAATAKREAKLKAAEIKEAKDAEKREAAEQKLSEKLEAAAAKDEAKLEAATAKEAAKVIALEAKEAAKVIALEAAAAKEAAKREAAAAKEAAKREAKEAKEDAAEIAREAKEAKDAAKREAAAAKEAAKVIAREAKEAKDAEKREAKEDAAEIAALQHSLIVSKTKDEIDKLIEDNDFHYCYAGNGSWYYKTTINGVSEWNSLFVQALCAKYSCLRVWKKEFNGRDYFSTQLEVLNRQVKTITMTWNQTKVPDVLNVLSKNFAEPAPNNATDYHWLLDATIKSITGGDVAAIESFEKTLWCKYLHPENYTLPALLFNDDGGTGKSMIVDTFITGLFGGAVSANLSAADLLGHFNEGAAGNAFLFLNETVRDAQSVDRLKALLGSHSITINAKFQSPYEAETTALIMASSNSSGGAFTLSGTDTDRRFSIFSSKIKFTDLIRDELIAHNVGEFNVNSSRNDIVDWIGANNAKFLGSKEEIGKWVNAMALKYGDVANVTAYQSADYKTILQRQQGAWMDTLHNVFSANGFSFIKSSTLIELVRHYNRGEAIPGKKTMNERIEKFIVDNNLPIERRMQTLIPMGKMKEQTSNLSCWVNTMWTNERQTPGCTDNKYFEYTNNGMKHWIFVE